MATATWVLAPNVGTGLTTVKATDWMTNLGTVGDAAHWAAGGDHTPFSDWIGRLTGYPEQGQIHAQDVGMSQKDNDLFEAWIRREWKAGRAQVKFININNRHYNLQTEEGWEAAVAGTIKPRWNADHHLHISYEDGTLEGDLLARFVRYRTFGGTGTPGVKALMDPNRIYNTPASVLVDDDGRRILASNIALAPYTALTNPDHPLYTRFVPGVGGPESKKQSDIVEMLVFLIGKSSAYWGARFNRGTVLSRRELDGPAIQVLQNITRIAGGKWDPIYPVDTWKALGFTDRWRPAPKK